MTMTTGAIYILTQNARYLPLALESLATVKRAMPDLPVTFLSQFPVSSPLIDRVIPVAPTHDGFYDKTRLMRESPYDRTLFIDADIYAVKPFPEMFDLLDRFDCAATHEEYLDTDWFHHYPATRYSSQLSRVQYWNPAFQAFSADGWRAEKVGGVVRGLSPAETRSAH